MKSKLSKSQEKRLCMLVSETKLLHAIGKKSEAVDKLKQFLASELSRQRKEFLKILKRLKLEVDVNVCECGEEWKNTDIADLIKEAIKTINNYEK